MLDFSEILYVYAKWPEKETHVFSFFGKIRIFDILAKNQILEKKPKKHTYHRFETQFSGEIFTQPQ